MALRNALVAVFSAILIVCAVDALWLYKIALPRLTPAPQPSATAQSIEAYQETARRADEAAILEGDRQYAVGTAAGIAGVTIALGGLVILIVAARART